MKMLPHSLQCNDSCVHTCREQTSLDSFKLVSTEALVCGKDLDLGHLQILTRSGIIVEPKSQEWACRAVSVSSFIECFRIELLLDVPFIARMIKANPFKCMATLAIPDLFCTCYLHLEIYISPVDHGFLLPTCQLSSSFPATSHPTILPMPVSLFP